MILLLGGTSETAPTAMGLAQKGYRVLVSTATDVPLDTGDHPNIRRRTGRLDETAMRALIAESGIRAVVDVAHPYASEAHATARRAAQAMNVPCFRLERPATIAEGEGIHFASDHDEAARMACSFGRPVLLTTGSRNLGPYVRESRRAGLRLIARVLPHPESEAACRAAGIPKEFVIAERGPFSVEQNRTVIRRFGIGVVVTKDSGDPGGAQAKAEASRQESCRLIVIRRPKQLSPDAQEAFRTVEDLLDAVGRLWSP